MCTWIIKIVRDEFNGIVNDSIVISRSYRQSCPRVKNTPSVNDAVVIRIPFPRNILHCRRRQVGSPQVSPSSPVSVVEMVDAKDHFTVEGMDAPCAIMVDMSHGVCSVPLSLATTCYTACMFGVIIACIQVRLYLRLVWTGLHKRDVN